MLEVKIEQLTAAINKLIEVMQTPSAPVVQAAPAPVVPVVQAVPTLAAPAPVVQAAPVASAAPFSDTSGMIQYVMSAYKALGPTKGADIQAVLTSLGYQNINEVKPEHFGALFSGIEALKP
jgi:hypothetical protein